MSVLGACLLGNPGTIRAARESLRPSDFYRIAHAEIYLAMCRIDDRGEPIDAVTLKHELEAAGLFESIGGVSYIFALGEAVPGPANIRHYCAIVLEKSMRRLAIENAAKTLALAYDDGVELPSLIETTERDAFALRGKRREGQRETDFGSALLGAIAEIEKGEGMPTGLSALDRRLTGLHKKEMTILAGRPGDGKSALAGQSYLHLARKGFKGILFTFEMAREIYTKRLVLGHAHVDSHKIRRGLDYRSRQRIAKALEELAGVEGDILDGDGMTIGELRGRCRATKRERGLDFVVVDYLQLVRGEYKENRQQEVSSVAYGLHEMAKELEIHVLACAQLNRGVEYRADKEPQLSDLRESGDIENAAENVVLIHRPHKDSTDPDQGEPVKLLVPKSRSGPTGYADVLFFRAWTLFGDPA